MSSNNQNVIVHVHHDNSCAQGCGCLLAVIAIIIILTLLNAH